MRVKLDVVETYRVDSDAEAVEFIDECKEKAKQGGYEISAYSSLYKEKKAKGQVVDCGYIVKITKHYSNFWVDGAF
jgi:hypothetical protein